MRNSFPLRLSLACLLILLVSGAPALRVRAETGPAATAPQGAPLTAPQWLAKALADGTEVLQEKINHLRSREEKTGEDLARAQADWQNRHLAVAYLKATLAVKRLPLARIEDWLARYEDRGSALKARLKNLAKEQEELTRTREEEITAQNTLRVQMDILQARKPEDFSPELQQSYVQYLKLAAIQDRLTTQVIANLAQERQILEQERELLGGVLPELKKAEQAWRAELLKRPVQHVSLAGQIARVWSSLAELPGRAWQYLLSLIASGRLAAFFWTRLASLVGLLGFIILMGYSTRWLNRLATRRFQIWREETQDLHLLPLFVLGHLLIANLFLLGLIFWVGLFFWIFGLLPSPVAQMILYVLVTLWAVRLTTQWVQGFFAGKEAQGVLSLDPETARFYRRSLKLFLIYLFLGIFGLKSAALLSFPPSSQMFLEHYFLVVILVWVLWLVRKSRLDRLLPEMPDPTWIHRPVVISGFRGLTRVLLTIIILADLLGFQNLSVYLSQAAAWTLLAVTILWFLWLAGERIILHLLHPYQGRAPRRFPEQTELLRRLYNFSRWALSLILGAAVVLVSLDVWGINLATVGWSLQWVTWGPHLGPAKLTLLNVGGALLALYLGFWLSRILRGLMSIRIFPRTGLDSGVQYTITTTVHYVVLILAILIALNILGFPLTNLALVAGALGVGIGFGLQNIVNNFLSGLILLFERPIKVGDMLVIDGQWGLVKEIRVRSTIFETFDRYVLIIPNSELVSSKVLNWTHYGAGINRLTLKVGVSYGSDVRQVTQLLTDICQANPRVVADPPPQIYFAVYGDSSLDFTIWVHLRTPSDRISATHELNSAIFETFREHGIEIPFPQRDLHIKEWPEPLAKPEEG